MPIIAWCIALVLCPTAAATSCGFRPFFEQNLQVLHTHLSKETTALPVLACIAGLACAARPSCATSPSSAPASPSSLRHQGPGIHKWEHYFSAYEQEGSRATP